MSADGAADLRSRAAPSARTRPNALRSIRQVRRQSAGVREIVLIVICGFSTEIEVPEARARLGSTGRSGRLRDVKRRATIFLDYV